MNTGMKSATIKSILRTHIKKWLDTIKDENVKSFAERDCFVTGGAIASMLQGEMPNDYDIYFKNKETAFIVADYYVKDFVTRADKDYRAKTKLYVDEEKWIANTKQYYLENKLPYEERARKHSVPTKLMHEPFVKLEDRVNCKGVTENRVIIYIKSAGVASENSTQYKYFEMGPEHEAEDFAKSLHSQAESQVETEFMKFHEEPVEYAELLLRNEVQRPAGRPTDGAEGRFRPVFMSENAITLSHKVQLIVRFSGAPEQIHENYDYAHCMCTYDFLNDTLDLPREALEAILSKTLIYKGSLYPIASIFRTRKFLERGWRVTAGQMLKMIMQVSEINLKDIPTLREQLIGVDQAYMHQLLRELENANGKVDSAYIAKIVDKIFE